MIFKFTIKRVGSLLFLRLKKQLFVSLFLALAYPKSFYDILNQKHNIPNEKHEQLNYEPTIYH